MGGSGLCPLRLLVISHSYVKDLTIINANVTLEHILCDQFQVLSDGIPGPLLAHIFYVVNTNVTRTYCLVDRHQSLILRHIHLFNQRDEGSYCKWGTIRWVRVSKRPDIKKI